jgi:hypothetical protein
MQRRCPVFFVRLLSGACSRLFAAIAASNPTEESDVRFSCFLCVV